MPVLHWDRSPATFASSCGWKGRGIQPPAGPHWRGTSLGTFGQHGGHCAARAFWECHTAHCSPLRSLNLWSPPSPQLMPTSLLGEHLCLLPIFTQEIHDPGEKTGLAGLAGSFWHHYTGLSPWELSYMCRWPFIANYANNIFWPGPFSLQCGGLHCHHLGDWLIASLCLRPRSSGPTVSGPESYKKRVCTTSMHVISESFMSWKW